MKLEALKELAAKVEAGEFYHDLTGDLDDLTNAQIERYFGSVLEQDHWARQAYNGSLDAAKALHDNVLPGWTWVWSGSGNGHVTPVDGKYSRRAKTAKCEGNPARAWLLAILRALIAQEEGK